MWTQIYKCSWGSYEYTRSSLGQSEGSLLADSGFTHASSSILWRLYLARLFSYSQGEMFMSLASGYSHGEAIRRENLLFHVDIHLAGWLVLSC